MHNMTRRIWSMLLILLFGFMALSLGRGEVRNVLAASPARASDLVTLKAIDCSQASSLSSIKGTQPTTIEFVNQTDEVVRIFWIDYQGNLRPYRALAPGHSYVQHTYLTHPWLVTDAQGNCLAIFLPNKKPGLAVITGS